MSCALIPQLGDSILGLEGWKRNGCGRREMIARGSEESEHAAYNIDVENALPNEECSLLIFHNINKISDLASHQHDTHFSGFGPMVWPFDPCPLCTDLVPSSRTISC